MGETEYGWWMQENLVNTVEEDMQQLVLGAQNSLSALEEIILVDGHYEIDLSIKKSITRSKKNPKNHKNKLFDKKTIFDA